MCRGQSAQLVIVVLGVDKDPLRVGVSWLGSSCRPKVLFVDFVGSHFLVIMCKF